MSEKLFTQRYKYTGPTMQSDYDDVFKDDIVLAEVNINIATVTAKCNGDDILSFSEPLYVAAKYLEPIKSDTINFKPDVDVPHFFDDLFSKIAEINAEHKFPFFDTENIANIKKWAEEHKQDLANNKAKSEAWEKIKKEFDDLNGKIYYTPKKVIDYLRKEARKRPDLDNFERVLNEMSDTHIAKNHDYGNAFSDLFQEYGMTYAYIHLKEKLNRIHTLMKSRQQVKQESLLDSLYDLANYAVMTIAEIQGKDNEE